MHIHVYSQMPVRCGSVSQDDEIFPHHFQALKTDLLVKLGKDRALPFFTGYNNKKFFSLLRVTEKLQRSGQTG